MLSLQGVTKRYPGVVANDRLFIDFAAGEVHVLLGENGAGKSTLVALLSGLQTPDQGFILLNGARQVMKNPAQALRHGIGTVYQHSMLVPSLSVAENIALGGAWWRRPDLPGIAARMATICQDIGVTLDPAAIVGTLSLGEQQQVEIIRALLRGSRFLILDEATGMLTPNAAQELGALMRRLAQRGLAVLFITHKLREALAFGDRISVLRHGRLAGQISPERLAGTDHGQISADIVHLMFGSAQSAAGPAPVPAAKAGDSPVLQAIALAVAHAPPIDLAISAGEIFGIAGIDGNGQKQFAEALAGQSPAQGGHILLDGQDLAALTVGERHKKGLRYVTDDRLGEGTIGSFPISLNLLFKNLADRPFWRHGIEQPAPIRAYAEQQVAAFDIRTPSVDTPIGKLSGGNIQKVLLARELSGPARAVIFAKPTNGLDVQNTIATRQRIRAAASGGLAILLISTDLDEILELSHRIAVMAGGRLVGVVENGPDARREVGEMMSGLAE